MANKKFKFSNVIFVVVALSIAFTLGLSMGFDHGYNKGFRTGEQYGLAFGQTKGELKVHSMWEDATGFGTEKPNKKVVKFIEDYVYER